MFRQTDVIHIFEKEAEKLLYFFTKKISPKTFLNKKTFCSQKKTYFTIFFFFFTNKTFFLTKNPFSQFFFTSLLTKKNFLKGFLFFQ